MNLQSKMELFVENELWTFVFDGLAKPFVLFAVDGRCRRSSLWTWMVGMVFVVLENPEFSFVS